MDCLIATIQFLKWLINKEVYIIYKILEILADIVFSTQNVLLLYENYFNIVNSAPDCITEDNGSIVLLEVLGAESIYV